MLRRLRFIVVAGVVAVFAVVTMASQSQAHTDTCCGALGGGFDRTFKISAVSGTWTTGGIQRQRIRGKAKLEMYQKLQEMQDHSKTMEGITEQQQLMEEMKKHMRMVDTMMEQMMMQLHRGIPRPQQETERQEALPGTRQPVEPQASPKELEQPEREEPHPGEHQ